MPNFIVRNALTYGTLAKISRYLFKLGYEDATDTMLSSPEYQRGEIALRERVDIRYAPSEDNLQLCIPEPGPDHLNSNKINR